MVLRIAAAWEKATTASRGLAPECGYSLRSVDMEGRKMGGAEVKGNKADAIGKVAAEKKTENLDATPRSSKQREDTDDAVRTPLGGQSRNASVSPGLSARMGGLVLTEKEAKGFVFKDSDQDQARPARWAAIGKAFTPRPINRVLWKNLWQGRGDCIGKHNSRL